MRILVVDDQTINQKLLQAFLKGYGLIELTNTAKEGLAIFIDAHAKQDPFEVVFIDIEMPNMNGFELGKAIREWEKENIKNNATLIFNSSLPEEGNQEKLKNSGCNFFMRKPLTVKGVRGFMDQFSTP